MTALSRAALLDSGGRKTHEVEIKALGGQAVLLRELTANEAFDFQVGNLNRETQKVDISKIGNAMQRLVAMSLVDPDTGDLMFSGKNAAKEVGESLTADVVTEIGLKVQSLNDLEAEEEGNESGQT